MRSARIWTKACRLGFLLAGLTGCEEKQAAEAQAAEQVEANPAQTAAPTPAADTAAPEPEAKPEEPRRPETIETELTDARRETIEKALTAAKGFIVASEIENRLKKNSAISAESSAVAAFDKAARGKWVLFTGPMVNLTESGFDMAITYTPRMSGDRMGLSRQFFTVTLSDVEGYDQDKFKAGNVVVVLANYQGKKQAKPGHELVATGHWK